MIIDSPIISGSQSASGPLTQIGDVYITGSLNVLGAINGSITGSITSASYATNAEFLDRLDSTSFVFTSSFNTFSGSAAGRITNLEAFSSSLDATFATDTSVTASILVLSQSVQASQAALSSSYTITSASFAQTSGSLSIRTGNLEATSSTLVSASSSFAADSASLSTRLTGDEANITTLTSASGSFAAQSASLSTRLTTDESNFNTTSGSLSTRVTNLESTSSTVSSSFATTSGSISSRVTIIEGQDATTGSNVFTGPQFINQASNAISFTSTASLYTDGGLRVSKDSFVSGTAYFNNVVVYGTSSIQYITSSQVNFGTNIITVNTDTPAVRFGGLAVYDSGSTSLTGSMLWDSEKNYWVYSNPSGSTYSGGMIISGPRNTGSLGNEVGTTSCALMMGQGGDHITSSAIFSYGNATCFYGQSFISSSGAACFSSTVCAPTVISTGQICSLMVNTGCIGIGIATPSSALQIYKTAYTGNQFKTYAELQAAPTTLCYTTSDGFGLILNMYEAISGAPYTRYADIVANTGDISNSAMRFFTKAASVNATEKMRITPDGDVGIGTTSPGRTLHILGQTGIGTVLKLEGAAGTTTYLQLSYNGATNAQSGYIGYDSSTNMPFFTNNTERMRITACGYVAVTGNQALSCVPYLQGMSFGWNRSNGQGESMINWTNAGGGTTCDLVFNFRDSSTLYERLRIASTGAATFSSTITGTTIYGSTAVCSPVGYFSGCVGIGTITPNTYLQIVGNISTTTGLEDAQFLTITNSNATANNYSAIMFKDSDGNNSAGFGVQQISHITNEADIVLSPRLANGDITERMRIKGNGNVGIGTASPCAKLHINGSTGASTYKGFAYTYAGSETLINEVLFQAVVGGYSSNLPIFLFKDERSDQGTTQRIFEIQGGRSGVGTILTTLASGNVGIGTCTPTDKLHVLGADNGITICSITANRPVLNFINGSTSMLKLSANATYGAIASCTGDLMYFYGSNVGIGTNSPTFSNGSGLVVHSDGASRIKLSNPTSGQGATDGFELIMAGTDAYVYNYEAGPMIFGAGNAERMRILSGGNIGIGTTDACSILDVRGTITNGATAGSNSTIDVSPAKQSIASGACVDFPSMSGMIVVNDWTDGTITIFLAGGGSTSAAASAAGQAGALYYNSGVTGYRWCNTKGYTACFGFLVFKTRNNA